MADRDLIVLNEDDVRLEVPQAGDRYVAPRVIVAEAGIEVPSGQLVGDLNPETAAVAVALISGTTPINTDDVNEAITLVQGSLVIREDVWDPGATGQFPVTSLRGQAFRAYSDATIDGMVIKLGDYVFSLFSNPGGSASEDWFLLRSTETINTVAGRTGDIVLSSADLTDGADFLLQTNINSLTNLRTVSNADLDETTDPRPPLAHTHVREDFAGLPKSFGYSFSSRAAAEVAYLGGLYEYSTTNAALTEGSTVTVGTANNPYGAKAFAIVGSFGTDGTNVTLTVSGDSIDESGTVTLADSETLYTGLPGALTANQKLETSKSWTGQVTYTLTSDGTVSTGNFNYGLVVAQKFAESSAATIVELECSGMGNAADASFDVEVLHHANTGWTYAATGFTPGVLIASMRVDYDGNADLTAGEQFGWRQSGSPIFSLAAGEGFVVQVTTGAANSVSYMNMNVHGLVDYS